jgi:hypothetical protein
LVRVGCEAVGSVVSETVGDGNGAIADGRLVEL